MSQSKVSRIETGRLLPSVVDVDIMLWALSVDQTTRAELITAGQRPGPWAGIGAWSRAMPPSTRPRCGLVRWIGETVRVGVAHGLRAVP
jgi:hypothetical protein